MALPLAAGADVPASVAIIVGNLVSWRCFRTFSTLVRKPCVVIIGVDSGEGAYVLNNSSCGSLHPSARFGCRLPLPTMPASPHFRSPTRRASRWRREAGSPPITPRMSVGLPFLTDPRFERDTLFVVFEEDWPLFEGEGEPQIATREDLESVNVGAPGLLPGEKAAWSNPEHPSMGNPRFLPMSEYPPKPC